MVVTIDSIHYALLVLLVCYDVVFSCSRESASCTTDQTCVAEVTYKVCKSIIRMVVMSYIVGIVCLSGNKNCAISFGYQQKKFLKDTKLEFHNKRR